MSHPRRILAAAAAAVAVIAAGLGGWGLHAATSSPAASPLSSAALVTASHQTAGQVYFYDGSSRWLYMSVDIGSGNGTVICQVEGPDGHLTTVGSFQLSRRLRLLGQPRPGNQRPAHRRPAGHHHRHGPGHRHLPGVTRDGGLGRG